jgi:hypothetical protein
MSVGSGAILSLRQKNRRQRLAKPYLNNTRKISSAPTQGISLKTCMRGIRKEFTDDVIIDLPGTDHIINVRAKFATFHRKYADMAGKWAVGLYRNGAIIG